MDKLPILIEKVEQKLAHLIAILCRWLSYPYQKFIAFLGPVFVAISETLQDWLRSFLRGVIRLIQLTNSMIGPRAWNFYKHKMNQFFERIELAKAKQKEATQKVSIISNIGIYFNTALGQLDKISPLKFAMMGFLFLVIMLNAFHFISTSTDLVHHVNIDREEKTRRDLASTIQDIPDYYNNLARLSYIKALKIPAQAVKTDKIKALEIDTHILFHSRTAKQFFDQNQIIFIDHLEMSLEPITPSFPLTPEGSAILKNKIKLEIDLVLKQYNIHATVENVFLTNIFAN